VYQNIKVLIVEDEEALRNTLAENLRAKGFNVAVAAAAGEALDLAKQFRYEILLVDYRLPDKDGLSLIKEISDFDKEAVPIVITGYSSVETSIESMKAGAHDFLTKPLDMGVLMFKIENIMKEKEVLNKGKVNLRNSIMKELRNFNDDQAVILSSKDSLMLLRTEGFFRKVILFFGKILRKLKRFYWG